MLFCSNEKLLYPKVNYPKSCRMQLICSKNVLNGSRGFVTNVDAEERQQRACPLACFLRLCGHLDVPVKFPTCISLVVAGRDVSWYALQVHLQATAASAGANDQQKTDVAIITKSWQAIQRRLRSKGVCCPQQLLVDPRTSPVMWLVPNVFIPDLSAKSPDFFAKRKIFPILIHYTEI